MRLNKLLETLAFSMLFGSGVTFANVVPITSAKDLPYEAVYKCGYLEDANYSEPKHKFELYINFMKDGGFIFENKLAGIFAETYGPRTFKETYLNKKAQLLELLYTDLGVFHKFVLKSSYIKSDLGNRSTIRLDKDVMIGTYAQRSTYKGEGTTDKGHKRALSCEQVYPLKKW